MNQLSRQQRGEARRDPTPYSISESSSSSDDYCRCRCRRIGRYHTEASGHQKASQPSLPRPIDVDPSIGIGDDPSFRGESFPLRGEAQVGAVAIDLDVGVQVDADQLPSRNDDEVNVYDIHREDLEPRKRGTIRKHRPDHSCEVEHDHCLAPTIQTPDRSAIVRHLMSESQELTNDD